MTELQLLDTNQTAEWLAIHDPRRPPRDAKQWGTYLRGNRVATRAVTYRLPYVKVGGRNVYSVPELQKFIEAERMRLDGRITFQAAKTMQAAESGYLNQRWADAGVVYGQFDQQLGPYVKLAIHNPLQTFRLSLQDAAALLIQLDDAIYNAESMAIERDPTYQRKLKTQRQR